MLFGKKKKDKKKNPVDNVDLIFKVGALLVVSSVVYKIYLADIGVRDDVEADVAGVGCVAADASLEDDKLSVFVKDVNSGEFLGKVESISVKGGEFLYVPDDLLSDKSTDSILLDLPNGKISWSPDKVE